MLQTLLEGNHTGQAVDYMRQITADLNKVHYTLSSGNTTVDCIVSNKQSMAENVGVLTENIIYLPEEIPLSDVEICSLLGISTIMQLRDACGQKVREYGCI